MKIRIRKFWIQKYIKLFQLFHPVRKQVLFDSFKGKQYSDNPRAVSEKLHQMFPQYEIVWLMKETGKYKKYIPDYVRLAEYNGKNLREELSKSFCYVTNDSIEIEPVKRKKQLYIQTWHGDRALKKVLYEADDSIACYDEKVTDLCIAGSEKGKEVYQSAFHYHGKILCEGMPRNDILFKDSQRNQEKQVRQMIQAQKSRIKKSVGICEETKVFLYAPTFRDHKKDSFEIPIDLDEVLEVLKKRKGGQWVCLVRAHTGSSIRSHSKQVTDVTEYPDMADLLLITDFFVTDYSASAGDFVLTKKPMILAVSDIEEYAKNDRQLAVNPEEAGYFTAHSQQKLLEMISELSEEDYKNSAEKVTDYFGIRETGSASEKVCRIIHDFYARHNTG